MYALSALKALGVGYFVQLGFSRPPRNPPCHYGAAREAVPTCLLPRLFLGHVLGSDSDVVAVAVAAGGADIVVAAVAVAGSGGAALGCCCPCRCCWRAVRESILALNVLARARAGPALGRRVGQGCSGN